MDLSSAKEIITENNGCLFVNLVICLTTKMLSGVVGEAHAPAAPQSDDGSPAVVWRLQLQVL